jgi:uncharacterized protein (TIGR03435 family)
MVDLIARAYSMDADKVVGGPNWLEYDRFDVIAKPPANTTQDTAKFMLQKLLADRFQLSLHKDTQSMPAFALTVGKGKPKMKEAEASSENGCKIELPGAGRGGGPPAPAPIPPVLTFKCRNMSMSAFASGMRNMLGAAQYVGTAPVQDKTGLEGAWDFDLRFSLPFRNPLANQTENITFEDALEKQLGLKLEPEKIPLPVVVVETVNRKPTPNSPGITERLPSPPSEFEVAVVKPSAPGAIGPRLEIRPGGRVNIGGMPVKFLIQQGWQIPNDRIIGAPKWMDTDRYDVVASLPNDDSAGPPGALDLDTIWGLLRGLLADRFQLKAHMEDRPMTAYTLVAVKPKLKKSDQATRTKWIDSANAPARDTRSGNTGPFTQITVQNMTMAQFAEKLQNIAPNYIRTTVLDATGLEGGYDFTFSFSPFDLSQLPNPAGRGGPPAVDAPAAPGTVQASDPSGTVTLFDAVEKQLGLKLEPQKRPVPVLVIDHVEQTPTDN